MSKAQLGLPPKYPRVDSDETSLLHGLRKYKKRNITAYRSLIPKENLLNPELNMLIQNLHTLFDLLENNLKEN